MNSAVVVMMFLCLAIILTMIGTRGSVTAVKCYKCGPSDSSGCDDPASLDECTGATCQKTVATLNGKTAVQRNCDVSLQENKCLDLTPKTGGGSAKGCFCTTDYCNSGRMLQTGPVHLLATLIVTIVVAAQLL